MGRLVYTAIGSLDGYLADERGDFGWAEPDPEVHGFANELERGVGTHLFGRRAYELMTAWELDPALAQESAETGEYAELWQRTDKVVYSTTLTTVPTRRTQLRRTFDPAEVARLKEASEAGLSVFGATLARQAFRERLVDELQVFLVPLVLGGGLSLWPDVRTPLVLREERRFTGGVVWLRYDVDAGT